MSPNDSLADVRAKARKYLRAGTRAAWIVEPRRRRVHVLGPPGARVLGDDDVLDGAQVLPGLAIRVARLYP
jgi:Uma2 family endonuclease